ncbi:hypothetical protein G9A89_023719 [Geosiphon pyriformis]|nr:hypothetical protein G9A89_023719 [Geosiphon pyriformis]
MPFLPISQYPIKVFPSNSETTVLTVEPTSGRNMDIKKRLCISDFLSISVVVFEELYLATERDISRIGLPCGPLHLNKTSGKFRRGTMSNPLPTTTQTWSCERCTFINQGIDLTCIMCYLIRTDAKDLPVQWEWRANPDQWIPYDLASSAELEEAYQRGDSSFSPKKGFFASTPDHYEIQFNYSTFRFQQLNTSSGGMRRMRRVANDDNSILQPVPFETVTCEETCIICLDGFQDPNTLTTDQHVVKLPPCHGHFFHRACVAAAIKLKDQCPLCKKRIEY